MIEIPKSNALEQQENELAQWVLDNLKDRKEVQILQRTEAVVLAIGREICQMKTNGTCLRLKR